MKIDQAIAEIDREFGPGYAKDHPNLVGALLHADALTEIDQTLADIAGHIISAAKKINLGAAFSRLFQ